MFGDCYCPACGKKIIWPKEEPPAPVAEYEIFNVQPIAYESNDPVCEYKGDCTVGCYFCKQYCKTNDLQNFAGHEIEGKSLRCKHKFNEGAES